MNLVTSDEDIEALTVVLTLTFQTGRALRVSTSALHATVNPGLFGTGVLTSLSGLSTYLYLKKWIVLYPQYTSYQIMLLFALTKVVKMIN